MPSARWTGYNACHAAVVGIFFVFLYFLIVPTESGDTTRYANDVVTHVRGHSGQFWEFGHLLWRPWGAVGLSLCGRAFRDLFNDTDLEAVTRFFVCTNFFCSAGTLFFFWRLTERLSTRFQATCMTLLFCGANSFLCFVTLGSAYVPALFFECLSLWLLLKAAENSKVDRALAAGVAYGVSFSLWSPYIFVAPGVLLSISLWTNKAPTDKKRLLFSFATGAVALSLVTFGFGAIGFGATTTQALHQWVADSDNGWSQQLNLVRAITGVPRALFELSDSTVFLKRHFFHDPYNPVSWYSLLGSLLFKLGLFYVGLTGLVWQLWQKVYTRSVLLMVLGAWIPLLFFAIFVFEPGSTSRYLPALPFLYLGAVSALKAGWGSTYANRLLTTLLLTAVTFNLLGLSIRNKETLRQVEKDKKELESSLDRPAVVFLPTLHNPFYFSPLVEPLNRDLISSHYVIKDVVEIASNRLPQWRVDFAKQTLGAWNHHQDVWISSELLLSKPPRMGSWVEGDDSRIHWQDLSAYFHRFQVDRKTSVHAGFSRLQRNAANRAILVFAGSLGSRQGFE